LVCLGRKAEDFALAQASPDRDRYEVAVPIGAAGEGKKDYRLIKERKAETDKKMLISFSNGRFALSFFY